MKKEVKLINKIKCLLKQLKCPRYGHRFGPKTYELYQHIVALVIRWYCKLSYRRVVKLLNLLGIECPSKSALQYNACKLKTSWWNKVIELTSGAKHEIIAIDATGICRTNPSYHYLKRIDGKMPKMFVKLNVALDIKNKKFCAAKIRVIPAHEIRDAKILIKRSKPKILVADKGYDANHLHEYCFKNNIEAHIPMRRKGRSKHERWSKRRLAAKHFNEHIYHRRELVESGFGSLKRVYGSNVNSKKALAIRSDIYGRMLCHNIFFEIIDF
ncbi:MAG: transposase [Nanoarchaeota archaeon]|nr:transposase [Nanoarchaeota archaeon]